jgi:hypothetical protein
MKLGLNYLLFKGEIFNILMLFISIKMFDIFLLSVASIDSLILHLCFVII